MAAETAIITWNGRKIHVKLKRSTSTKDIYVDEYGTEYEVAK